MTAMCKDVVTERKMNELLVDCVSVFENIWLSETDTCSLLVLRRHSDVAHLIVSMSV